jgi:hypothetical protein
MDLSKSSEAGKTNHAVKMLKSGYPDAYIISALGISAGFLSKARIGAGLLPLTKVEINRVKELASQGLSDRVIAKRMGLRHEDSPEITAAKADVIAKTKDLAKALHKEDAVSYVPRFTKQLIDMGVEDKMIYTCFTEDQRDRVTKTLQRFRKTS